jgi:hypothetical protein
MKYFDSNIDCGSLTLGINIFNFDGEVLGLNREIIVYHMTILTLSGHTLKKLNGCEISLDG